MTPEGWQLATIREAADIVGGFAFPHVHQGSVGGPYPFFKVSDMNRPGNELRLWNAENTVDDEAIKKLRARVYPEGTIVFPKVGAALLTNKRRLLGRPGLFDNNVMGLVPSRSYGPFLLYFMQTIDFLSMVQPGAVPSVNGSMVGDIRFPLPPLGEQKKIAAILSTVDEAIEATRAVIDQLQAVRKAMMAELLTRGLPGRHTQFKQTEIGELPEDWQVVELGSVLATMDAGWSPQCETRPAAPEEWGVLKLSAVTSGVYLDSEQKALPNALAPRPDVEVRAGDVLLARANGVLELVGRTVLVRATRPRLMLSDKVLRLRPAASHLHGEFLTLAMATEAVRSRLLSTTGGSHMRNVSQSALRVLKLPLPSPDEQAQISAIIGSVDLRTESEVEALAALRDFKAALMSVLLTGEVRVKPDEEAA